MAVGFTRCRKSVEAVCGAFKESVERRVIRLSERQNHVLFLRIRIFPRARYHFVSLDQSPIDNAAALR